MTGCFRIAPMCSGRTLSGALSADQAPPLHEDHELSPRMKLLVNFIQPRGIDVRVNLRRANAGMAEHFLHLP